MIGRKKELEIIKDCMKSDRSRLIVVYGRRRVGKTFLVREAFNYKFTFTHTGLEDGNFNEQHFGVLLRVKANTIANDRRTGLRHLIN